MRREKETYRISQVPRVVFVGDKEGCNLAKTIEWTNLYPTRLQVGGLIVPGGECDGIISLYAPCINGMTPDIPRMPILEFNDSKWADMMYVSLNPPNEFYYFHVPYTPQELREKGGRKRHSKKLLGRIRRAGADVVALVNLKVVLDKIVVEAFPERLINVHPSILPEFKGLGSEAEMDRLGAYHALGWTVHYVDPDLDGGATIAQQRVRVDPYDTGLAIRMGETEYMKFREEILRTRIIEAESDYLPLILDLILNDPPRMLVFDQEAFAVEGRPNYMETEGYLRSLQQDYGFWIKQGHKLPFERWRKNHRKPYQRMLFDAGFGWTTAENILGVPKYSQANTNYPIHHYQLDLCGNSLARSFFGDLARAGTLIETESSEGRIYYIGSRDPNLNLVDIVASIDLRAKMKLLGISYVAESLETRVKVPRKPVRKYSIQATLEEDIISYFLRQ